MLNNNGRSIVIFARKGCLNSFGVHKTLSVHCLFCAYLQDLIDSSLIHFNL